MYDACMMYVLSAFGMYELQNSKYQCSIKKDLNGKQFLNLAHFAKFIRTESTNKMACSKWPLFVARFFIFVYTCLSLYYMGGLMGLYNFDEETTNDAEDKSSEKVVDPDNTTLDGENLKVMSREDIAECTIDLVSSIAVAIASVFLYVGLKMKMHKLILPWLVVSFLYVFVESIVLFIDDESEIEEATIFVVFLYVAAMWYPIYKQYKAIRCAKCKPQQQPTQLSFSTTEFVHHQTATAPVEV
ncbi:uncharacterized protein LOC106090971 isoform X1 [Stomoxys calcitrans]|uniref:uncharacterized protein LOC106090971 isoform X1 n=1 Tax=Stomoxys calcitrans TaxID=35570 RepID=UPI0027E3536D|nr:uncharacterized protein LOC106090971 isoform X1 [Stomoxys calcitrans]